MPDATPGVAVKPWGSATLTGAGAEKVAPPSRLVSCTLGDDCTKRCTSPDLVATAER
jgi:hypothetical protein